jgi:hypothetical protein
MALAAPVSAALAWEVPVSAALAWEALELAELGLVALVSPQLVHLPDRAKSFLRDKDSVTENARR